MRRRRSVGSPTEHPTTVVSREGFGGKPPRVERVSKQLRQEISQLMVKEMKDPRVRLASISEVRISPDLRTARVMVSAIGTDEERRAVVTGLRHAAGYLRSQLGSRLENLNTVPRLHFELDLSIEYSVMVNDLIGRLGPATATAAAQREAGAKHPEGDRP